MATKRQPIVAINPRLCAACLGIMVVDSACETVFKLTAGAFIGLLGGRAAAPEAVRKVPPAAEPSTRPAGG